MDLRHNLEVERRLVNKLDIMDKKSEVLTWTC